MIPNHKYFAILNTKILASLVSSQWIWWSEIYLAHNGNMEEINTGMSYSIWRLPRWRSVVLYVGEQQQARFVIWSPDLVE